VLAGLLVRLVAHEHRALRERAWVVLRTLAGQDPAADATDLRLWWLRSRDALAREQAALLAARRRPTAPPAGGVPPAPDESVTVPADRNADLYDYVAELRRDGLEVCIVMDSTGSMGQVIGRARDRAASLVKRLAWLVPRFRAGLVTYDDAARLRIALTTDGGALEEAFGKLVASGGGDWEEGVDKGIALALRQERMAWSAKAWRVLIVIGDAPPHLGDVSPLLKRIVRARADPLYVHSVIVNTVSTHDGGVDHFEAIAAAGGGLHVTLGDTRRLEAELVALSFGAAFRDRVQPWLDEVALLRD
jgi:Mg-chelatase subunit ChlD